MRKSDKKMENLLRIALTDVCESALKNDNGFVWLTHLVNYSNFPKSLKVICVFDTNDNLAKFRNSKSHNKLSALIATKLFEIGVNFKNIANHVSYDTEEDCDKSNNGKWAERLE